MLVLVLALGLVLALVSHFKLIQQINFFSFLCNGHGAVRQTFL